MKLLGLFITSLVLLAACRSDRAAFDDVAREVNPYLEELRPPAAAVLSADQSDHVAIVRACTDSDVKWSLDPLRRVRFDRLELGIEDGLHPSFYADYLLYVRCPLCGRHFPEPDLMTPRQLATCARSCRETWKALVESVERVRVAAAEHDVDIVSLKP